MHQYELSVPAPGTSARAWWDAGTAAEAKARDEGVGPAAAELREMLEILARIPGNQDLSASTEALAGALARFYCPNRLRRRFRLRY
jgi:hypothetical protein